MLHRIRQVPHNPVFFLLAAAYVGLVVEPRLIYPCFGTILADAPTFLTGWPFLQSSLGLPGGPVAYVAGFLSQSYYYSWLGTLIIVSSALGLCELSRRHLAIAGYARASILTTFAAILLFLMYSGYAHPLPVCLAVSLGLLWSLVFERLPLRGWVTRVAAYCLMAASVFWLAGAGGLLVFSLMTVIYAVCVRRDWGFSVLVVPASLAIVWGLALYVFLISPRQALLILTPASASVTEGMKTFSKVLLILLYVFVPLSVSLRLLSKEALGRLGRARKKPSKVGKRRKGHGAPRQERLAWTLLKESAMIGVPIALMAAGLCFSRDSKSKPFLLAHDYALRGQWDKILELGRSLPQGESNVYFDHNIIGALYHTGRLPYDLFDFPQTPHGLFLTHEKRVSYLTQLKLCDTYLELGLVNMAEKLASEILATKGHCGFVVERMAWINILKGQTGAARIYLNVLKKDLVHRGTANALLGALDNGFTPDQTAYVDRIRSCMPGEGDAGTGRDSIEKMLTGLLERNPRNQMAFEYLMTLYLLTGQVEKLAANIGRLNNLGYQTIPTLYEEAMLIYFGSHGQKVDRSRFAIKPQTIERYAKFVQLCSTMEPRNRQAVLGRMIVEFGNSYFFYHTFGCVGLAGPSGAQRRTGL